MANYWNDKSSIMYWKDVHRPINRWNIDEECATVR